MNTTIEIRVDDLNGDATRALITSHLAGMHDTSPPESVHALDIDALRDPAITFWSAWIGARQQAGGVGRSPIGGARQQAGGVGRSPMVHSQLAGIGALKRLDAARGELKSMRVDDRFRGSGVGRAILRHIMHDARERGMTSLWLETGSTEDFLPARRLYESEGFVECGPFEDYALDPFSIFLTRAL